MLPADTTREAYETQLEVWRGMSGSERVELAFEMSRDAREVSLAGIRHRHPEYSEEQTQYALFRMLLGDSLFRAAYPHAALLDP